MDGTLTADTIRERVASIRDKAHDPERAHDEEDSLHKNVLEAIADGRCDDPVACAREALKTTELDFPRWCA